MKFFILFDGQNYDDAIELGDLSFKTFYAEVGLKVLSNILENSDAEKLLKSVIIKDEKNKVYSVQEFLDVLEKSNVFTQ